MARQSYFAEKRGRNNDPNFFNRLPIEEIRKNVKRIIRDVKYDNIQEQDFNYFYSKQIIQACLMEAYDNWMDCSVISNSLNIYINEFLNKNLKPFPSTNIIQERNVASKQQCDYNIKTKTWYNLYQIFNNIWNGANKEACLNDIKHIDNKFINML